MYVSLHKIYWWCNISIVKLSVKRWPLLLLKQTFLSIKILSYMDMTLDLGITILLMDSSSAMTLFLNCPQFKALNSQLTTLPSNLRAILEKIQLIVIHAVTFPKQTSKLGSCEHLGLHLKSRGNGEKVQENSWRFGSAPFPTPPLRGLRFKLGNFSALL